jgi:hypothetical protein
MSAAKLNTVKGQILLKKKPTMSHKQFCDYWENDHGQLALPWALDTGVLYYAQVCWFVIIVVIPSDSMYFLHHTISCYIDKFHKS